MKKIFLLFLLLLSPVAWAAPTVTVTASSATILGTSQTISLTCTLIDPNQTGVLRTGGTVLTNFAASTATPGTTATCGPIFGNDVITDGFGNASTSYYLISVYTVSGGIVASTPSVFQAYQFAGSGTFDLSSTLPFALGAVSPAGSVLGQNLTFTGTDVATGPWTFGNLTVTNLTTTGSTTHNGTETFSGNIIVSTLNGQPIVGGSVYPCTAAGHLAAIAALASTGGKVDATACTGPINFTATVNYGTSTQPIALWLGAEAITFTNTTGNGFQLNGRSDTLIGLGPLNSNLLCGAGFTGDLIHVEPLSGSDSVDAIQIRGMRLDANGNGTCKLLNMLSVRENSVVDTMQLRTFTGTALNVGISSVASPGNSQQIAFTNFDAESNNGTLTAASIIIQCDACYLGPNFFVAGNATPVAGTKGIVINGSSSGDGRANTLINGSITGYDTDLFISGTSGGAGTSTLITGFWFENFNTAWNIAGLSGFPATHNSFHGNFYLPGSGTGATFGKIDFGNLNSAYENTSAGSGKFLLTANSTNNTLVLYGSTTTDVTDSGVGNHVEIYRNNAGTSETDVAGQFRIMRNGTLADQWDFLDNNSLTGSTTSGIILGNKGLTFTSAAAGDLGSTALPAGNLWLGTAATNNFKVQPAATAAARTINLWDFGANGPSTQNYPGITILTSQYTNSTTGFTNVAGGNTLQFPVLANTTYTAECHLYYQAAATGGLNIEFTGPAAPTAVIYGLNDPSNSTVFNSAVATAFGASLGQAAAGNGINFDAMVSFSLINGANAGTVNLLAKSSAAAQLQIQAGSFCRIQ